jgi:hypothetical protein
MSQVSPQLRRFAQRLLAYEASLQSKSSDGTRHATLQVIDELRPHVVNLMGMAGFRAFLSRAVARSSEEVRWLRAVHVKADGSLGGFEEYASLGAGQFAEGKVALLAQFLEMLVALIGVPLTLRMVFEIWPTFARQSQSRNGEAHEEEK